MGKHDRRSRDFRRSSLEQAARRPLWVQQLWNNYKSASDSAIRHFIGLLRWVIQQAEEKELERRERAGEQVDNF